MATCLGIYVDKNIIKYSKVSRDKDNIKIDAYGVEVYSNIKETLQKIIDETYSYNIPISINLVDEVYDYFYMSNLLNNKDLKKAIKTEFDSYCYDHEINPNALETRYALVNDLDDKDKIKVINVSIDKIKLHNLMEKFGENIKVTTASPLPLNIANIAPLDSKSNVAIVNIEEKTKVTIITGEKVYDIKDINVGAEEILNSINQRENSYRKAYEGCKNTTIYTMEGRDLQSQDNEYLNHIVPTLYDISTQLNEIIKDSLVKISKVYITGTGAIINNVDLYFEELLDNVKCEILKPFFIENTPKINIKDYIEVNSAIAIALQGLGYGIQNINFSKNKTNIFDSLGSKEKKERKGIFAKIPNIKIPDFPMSRWLKDALIVAFVAIIGYTGVSIFTNNEINVKDKNIEYVRTDTNKQIDAAKKDLTLIQNKTAEYNSLTKKLQEATNQISTRNSYKNMIPVFLSEVARIIPKEVQLTSIQNPSEKKIIIYAQSSKYEQLAYFKARIRTEGILKPSTVVSSEAIKNGSAVEIVIEGELP